LSKAKGQQAATDWNRYEEAVRTIVAAYKTLGQRQYVDEVAARLKADPTCLDLSHVSALNNAIKGIEQKTVGLYLFEACFANYVAPADQSPADAFIAAWEDSRKEHKPASPNVNKARIREHLAAGPEEWHALYLGKGQDLRDRLQEHLTGAADDGWSCLRLGQRAQVFEGVSLRLSWCEVPLGAQHYDLVVPYFEKQLHRLWKPILGNSR